MRHSVHFLMFGIALVGGACSTSSDVDTTSVTVAGVESTATTEAVDETGIRVAFVHEGVIADGGWSWTHDQGARHVAEALGDAVAITTIEGVGGGLAAQSAIDGLAFEGFAMIIATSPVHEDGLLAVAAAYPDVMFLQAGGSTTTRNVGTYHGAREEASYLAGIAAGASSGSDLIGYIGSSPSADAVRAINAFTLGVQEVAPSATVKVAWTFARFDPPLEGTVAQALVDGGADVLAVDHGSAAAGLVAAATGAKWVGDHASRQDIAPDAWLTAPTWDWGPFYLATVESLIEGTWSPGATYGDLAGGMVALAPLGPSVSSETERLIELRRRGISTGTFAIFSDPITDQDGLERPLGDLDSMDYFVEGVVGSPGG